MIVIHQSKYRSTYHGRSPSGADDDVRLVHERAVLHPRVPRRPLGLRQKPAHRLERLPAVELEVRGGLGENGVIVGPGANGTRRDAPAGRGGLVRALCARDERSG